MNPAAEYVQRLKIERQAVETLYQAFSDNNPDLVDSVLAPSWEDILLAPGQVAGPEGIKPIIRMLAQAFPDVQIVVHDMIQEPAESQRGRKSAAPISAKFSVSRRPARKSASVCMSSMRWRTAV
jgi:SnoaL-like polyketide cyclase.